MPKSTEQIAFQRLRESEIERSHREESGQVIVNPVITISRSMGSGGLITAKLVAEKLGFSLWDKELINAMAESSQMPSEVVEAFDERRISEIELLIYACLGRHQITEFLYLKHLTRIVATIASVGNAVILGRGVNFLLQNALNIRMDASIERRVENMVKFEGGTNEEAEKKIRKSDKDREHYLTGLFGKEKIQTFHYDVSLWMDKLTPDCAAKIIETAYNGFYQSK